MSRTADKKNRGLVEFLSICQVLCARKLLLWLLVCERACRYFLKVSNGRALGEYSEMFGFASLFYLPRAH